MDTTPTIDLGLAGSRPWDAEALAGARGSRRRRFRTLALALAVVLALSGPPPRPIHAVAPLGMLPLPAGGAFQLFPDGLYTFVQAAGASEITAYSVAGVAGWRRSLPTTADSVVIAEATGVTLVQFEFASTGNDGYVWVLDRRTGRLLWQERDATIVFAQGARVLMSEPRPDGALQLSWFDATTGHAYWRHPLEYDWDLSPVTADGSAIFALSPTGDVHEFATDDRGTEHEARLTGVGFDQYDEHTLLTFGDVLVMSVPGPGTSTIVGYRISAISGAGSRDGTGTGDGTGSGDGPSVAPLWSDEVAATGRIGHDPGVGIGAPTPTPRTLSIASCGVVLCAYFGVDVRGIDPRDGSVRWYDPSSLVSPIGSWLVREPINNTANLTDSVVTDPLSGRVLLHLGPWSAASATSPSAIASTFSPAGGGNHTSLFIAQAGVAAAAGLVPAGYSPTDVLNDNFTAFLGSLEPTEGLPSAPHLRIIGVIRVPGFECQVVGDHLACSGSGGGAAPPPRTGGLVQTWSIRGS